MEKVIVSKAAQKIADLMEELPLHRIKTLEIKWERMCVYSEVNEVVSEYRYEVVPVIKAELYESLP